ncbi:MAG: ion channel [Motiliproteus sp.]
MLIITRLARSLARHLVTISWQVVLATLVGYVAISWFGLYLAQEPVATGSPLLFWYFLVVSSSTVGYGDYSAATPAGMLVISTWVIPIGLVMWGTIIGRVAAAVISFLQRGVKGMRQVSNTDHTLVIGYNGVRTMQLLRLLLREAPSADDANIVLCASPEKITANPMPGIIGFIRVESFNNPYEMQRTNVKNAKAILIDTPLDDITLTTAMFCHQQNPHAHIMAYFNDDDTADLLKENHPSIECIPSVSVEMLAKAAADPGSSALHYELLSVDKGQTQYSVVVPTEVAPFNIRDVYLQFKEQFDATIIAVQSNGPSSIITNPPLDTSVSPGARIHYIADERITEFNWGDR